eukprot:gnl/TRDRNA2_/TRDRNA2_160080_c0_seq3.p1 gnl/TRDRNA2_/TRDRNA2_160080_c0~~gnl/TRDRNA2_/TRDRNA2_160080_c0_seq3.p1  ORF type:complete len:304 (-),score=58.59 gnl/TRDRNA2_/TRDRNA2_160080_c0_seq3:74-985(-)
MAQQPAVFRNDGRWRFDFRVHETPVYRRLPDGPGVPTHVQDSGFAIVEIEGSARDAQNRTARLAEELRLVELDLREREEHPRLLYYAGVLRYELASELRSTGETVEVSRLAKEAVKLLARRAKDSGREGESEEWDQQRTAAAYYCGRTYQDLMGKVSLAEKYYRRAIKLEPDFLYAHVALVHLLFKLQRYEDALAVALAADTAGEPRARLFMDSRPLQICDMPLLLSKALYFSYTSPILRPQLLAAPASEPGGPGSALRRRAEILEGAKRACPEAAGDAESAGRKLKDIQQLEQFWKAERLRL